MYEELKDWLKVPITIHRTPTRDEYGDEVTYDDTFALCYLEQVLNTIVTRDGRSVLSTTTVWLDGADSQKITKDCTIKTPDEEIYPVQEITKMYDHTGQLHLIKVFV